MVVRRCQGPPGALPHALSRAHLTIEISCASLSSELFRLSDMCFDHSGTCRRCAWVIEKRFPTWLDDAFGADRAKTFLVQDHEKPLWTAEPRSEMKKIGVSLLEQYPKCSQDMNAIEAAWKELRERLYSTQPVGRETRDEFVTRLRAATAWLNRNKFDYLMYLCNRQKEVAHEVVHVRKGARTHF